ncbi:peptide/nickel transport system substrate-binding protein [Arthrobacter subterraneus]|uniref:Peptide/nickel transport system substrate-binding protein n=1 Tax=Arthrobacter subterraneus TaxID=335973 RepID=A0A1G8NER2_9MICC|nr:ABC transporter substrate-binding protein [Arthrobacter subterraneus]SDI78749.1 peptide/nickel transport system substrate-binding protein [Arthrobacter subterraneus]
MPLRPSLLSVTTTVALSALLLTGCASSQNPAGTTDAQTGDGVLDVIGPLEVHSLDPTTAEGIFTRLQVAETLVDADGTGALRPGLAAEWAASGDGLQWTFTLRNGAQFHDGTPVDAESVVAALELARASEANTIAVAPITGISAEEGSVLISLSEPFAPLPAVLAATSTQILAPSSYAEDGSVSGVVGSGPYQVVEVAPPSRIELEAFGGYDGEPAQAQQVIYESVGRAENRALMGESGQADVVFGMDATSLQRVKGKPGLQVESALLPRTIVLKLNAAHPALSDERVRQALSLALDRPAMATAVLRDPDIAATQMFPPALEMWHDDGLDPLTHDPERAATLLEDAGWTLGQDGVREKGGEPLTVELLTFPDRPELPTMAAAIQAALGEIGVTVEVRVDNSSEIPAGHASGALEMALFTRNFALVPDPIVTLLKDYPADGGDWGAMNWSDPDMTAALDRLTTEAEYDGAAADTARTRIAGTLQEQLPVIPVSWYRQSVIVNDAVEGFVLDPLERNWNLAAISFKE